MRLVPRSCCAVRNACILDERRVLELRLLPLLLESYEAGIIEGVTKFIRGRSFRWAESIGKECELRCRPSILFRSDADDLESAWSFFELSRFMCVVEISSRTLGLSWRNLSPAVLYFQTSSAPPPLPTNRFPGRPATTSATISGCRLLPQRPSLAPFLR